MLLNDEDDCYSPKENDDGTDLYFSTQRSGLRQGSDEKEIFRMSEKSEKFKRNNNSNDKNINIVQNLDREIDDMWKQLEDKDMMLDKRLNNPSHSKKGSFSSPRSMGIFKPNMALINNGLNTFMNQNRTGNSHNGSNIKIHNSQPGSSNMQQSNGQSHTHSQNVTEPNSVNNSAVKKNNISLGSAQQADPRELENQNFLQNIRSIEKTQGHHLTQSIEQTHGNQYWLSDLQGPVELNQNLLTQNSTENHRANLSLAYTSSDVDYNTKKYMTENMSISASQFEVDDNDSKLQYMLQQKDQTINMLIEQIQKLKTEYQDVMINSQNNTAIMQKEEDGNDKTELTAVLRQQRDKLIVESTKQKEIFKRVQAQNSDLKSQIKILEESNNEISANWQQISREKQTQYENLQTFYKNQHDNLTGKLKQYEGQMTMLRKRIQQLEEQNISLNQLQRAQSQRQSIQRNNTQGELQFTIEGLESQVKNLNQQLAQSDLQFSELSRNHDSLQSENQKYREHLQNSSEQLIDLKAKLSAQENIFNQKLIQRDSVLERNEEQLIRTLESEISKNYAEQVNILEEEVTKYQTLYNEAQLILEQQKYDVQNQQLHMTNSNQSFTNCSGRSSFPCSVSTYHQILSNNNHHSNNNNSNNQNMIIYQNSLQSTLNNSSPDCPIPVKSYLNLNSSGSNFNMGNNNNNNGNQISHQPHGSVQINNNLREIGNSSFNNEKMINNSKPQSVGMMGKILEQELRDTIASVNRSNQRLRTENEILNREIVNLKLKAEGAREIEELLDKKDQQILQLDSTFQEAKREMDRINEQNDFLKNQIRDLETELEKFEEGLRQMNQEVILEREKSKYLAEELDRATNQLENRGSSSAIQSFNLNGSDRKGELFEVKKRVGYLEDGIEDLLSHVLLFLTDFKNSSRFPAFREVCSRNFLCMLDIADGDTYSKGAEIQFKQMNNLVSCLLKELEYFFKNAIDQNEIIVQQNNLIKELEAEYNQLRQQDISNIEKQKDMSEQSRFMIFSRSNTKNAQQFGSSIKPQARDDQDYSDLLEELRVENQQLQMINNNLEKQVGQQQFVKIYLTINFSLFCSIFQLAKRIDQAEKLQMSLKDDKVIHRLNLRQDGLKQFYSRVTQMLLNIIPNPQINDCANLLIEQNEELQQLENLVTEVQKDLGSLEGELQIVCRTNIPSSDKESYVIRQQIQQKRDDLSELSLKLSEIQVKISNSFEMLSTYAVTERRQLQNILNVEQENIRMKNKYEQVKKKNEKLLAVMPRNSFLECIQKENNRESDLLFAKRESEIPYGKRDSEMGYAVRQSEGAYHRRETEGPNINRREPLEVVEKENLSLLKNENLPFRGMENRSISQPKFQMNNDNLKMNRNTQDVRVEEKSWSQQKQIMKRENHSESVLNSKNVNRNQIEKCLENQFKNEATHKMSLQDKLQRSQKGLTNQNYLNLY